MSKSSPAAEASTLQHFRDLFGSEVLAPGQQLAVRHIALLFSGLEGSTRLYEQLGDGAAYSRPTPPRLSRPDRERRRVAERRK